MKKVFKSSLSILLTFLIIVSALPISGFATSEDELNSSITDISTESVNALGEVLSEPLNSSGEEVGYSVGKIDFADMVATVTLYAPDNSTVLVCLYDESDNRLVTSGKASVNSSTEEIAVELAECELPEYFVIKGYIVDENNKPVSNVYENIEFTQRMEEFHAKTVNDFDPAYVINLDTAIDNNFAVVDGAAEAFEASSTENTVVTDDYEKGEYVISNASDELKAVAKGDIVFIKTGDGAEDFILAKVDDVDVDGSTVSIKSAESAKPEELFQFIKFDTSRIGSTNTLSDTGDANINEKPEIPVNLSFSVSNRKDADEDVVVTKKCLDYEISANVFGEIKIDFKYYRDKSADINYCEYTKTFDIDGNFNVEVSGTFGVRFTGEVESLPFYGFQIFAQILVDFELQGKVNTEINFSYEATEGYIKEISRFKGINRETITSEKPKPKIKFTEDIDVKVSLKLTLKAGISFIKVLKAYLQGSAELKMENDVFDLEISNSNIGSSFPFLPWSETNPPEASEHPCKACVRVSLDLELKASVVLEASLNKYDYDEELEKNGFDFGVKAERYVLSKPITIGDFRASYCNNKFEFEKIGDNSICPHQAFLMAFLVVNPDEENAPVSNATIKIKADETTLKDKKSEYYNPHAPKEVTITTDSNGFAKTFLPGGVYSYEFKSNGYMILPGSKPKDEFIVVDKTKDFMLEAGRTQNVTVNVTDTEGNPLNGIKVLCDEATAKTNADGQATLQVLYGQRVFSAVTDDGKSADATVNVTEETNSVNIQLYNGTSVTVNVVSTGGSPVKNANVNGLLTDAEGKVRLKLDKGNHTITASYNDKTVKKEITFDEEPIETTITLDLGYKVTCIVKNTEGTFVQGVEVQGVKTDANGEAVLWMQNGEHTISVNSEGDVATKTFVVDNSDVTIELVIDSYMEWSLTDGHLVISGCGDMGSAPWLEFEVYTTAIKKVTINEGITSIIDNAFHDCYGLTTITIPDNVTSIGNCAFEDCVNLTSVTIGDNVTSIGYRAFENCVNLTSVTIGDSVTSIGDEAFDLCESLTSIEIPEGVTCIGYAAFYHCTSLTSIEIPEGVTSIGNCAFYGCTNLTSVTIPDSVRGIGYSAFYNTAYYNDSENRENDVLYIDNHLIDAYTSLRGEYVIRDGTKTIAGEAFRSCDSLTSVTIGDSVTIIGADAFEDCDSLTSVTIGENVTSIGVGAFGSCDSIEEIYWNAKNVADFSSNSNAFYNSGFDSGFEIVFGNSVERIPSYLGCGNLTTVTICDSVTSIGNGAFAGCGNLTTVTIGDSVTSIGDEAFVSCDSLISITIPDSVTSIGDEAFVSCDSLISITIPDSVTSIGDEAFGSCDSLTSVTIGDSVTSIGDEAFSGCTSIEEIYWNAKNVADFNSNSNVFYNSGIDSGIEIVFGNSVEKIPAYLCSDEGAIFDGVPNIVSVTIGKNVKSIGNSAFLDCTNLTSITIPDSVTSVGYRAFSGCTGLEKIYWNAKNVDDFTSSSCILYNAGTGSSGIDLVFGDSVEKIPAYLCYFYNSSYKPNIISITIGKNVETIGEYVFYGCTGFTSITIPENVTSIGDSAFRGCTSLTSVTIGENVTCIGSYAFYGCENISSILIPENVTNIGVDAFYNCTNLEYIKWNAKNVDDFYSSSEIFCKAGINGKGIEFVFGDTVEKIPAYLCYVYSSSYKPNIVSVTVGKNIKTVGESAFKDCTSLKSVYITDVEAWCNIDFYNVDSNPLYCANDLYINDELTTDIVLPLSVTSIGKYAFYSCHWLKSIIIPDSVTSIGELAFYNCTNLESVTIGDGVTNIGDSAFRGCTSLTSVTIGENVTYIGDSAFYNCTNLEKIWWNAESVEDITRSSGILYEAGISGSGIELVFGDTVKVIPEYLCYASSSSYRPKITSVTLGKTVTSIGAFAFYNCTTIEYIKWKAKNCTTNSIIGYPVIFGSGVETFPTNVTNIAFDSSYTSIPEGAFKHSSVENVYIHSGITEIGKAAFYKCNNIQNIYYEGTPEQWAQVDKGHSNTALDNKASYNATMPGEIIEIEEQASFFGYVKSVLSSFKPLSVDYTIEDGNISIVNAENGTTYMVYIVKSESAEDFLSPDNLLYVSQGTATREALKIPYNLRENYEDFAVVITAAKVTVPDCDANGHVFTTGETNYLPTCTEEGSEIAVCRLCGYTEYIATEPTGHRYVTIPGCAATCTEPGYTESVVCEICNEISTESTVISAGHTYGDWVIVTEATETTDGERSHTCTDCGYEESQVVRALPILEEDVSENIKIYKGDITYAVFIAPESATYSFASNSNSYDTKGYLYDSENQLLASNDDGLTDVNFEVVFTLEKGETYYIGVEADNTYDASISISVSKACFHENVTDHDAIEVTCTTDGYTAGKLCNSCGKWIKGHRKISATGHSYGDWVVETEATCTTNGLKSRECTSCRYENTATIYATGHSGEWIVDTESTCSVQGSKHMDCTICGERIENMLPFAKHSYADGFCSVCGIEQLPESAHPYVSNFDDTQTIYKEGAASIELTFSSDTKTETGWDYIYIYDADDIQIGRYTGTELAEKTVVVNGDTAKIRLTSDGSNEYYGYCVINIVVNYVEACSHETTKWITDQEATVYKAGSKHKECTECGEVLKTATIKQLTCSKPVLKKVYNANDYVKVTWGAVKGADLYRVYRKTGTGEYEYIGSTTHTYFNDKEAGAGKTCRYIVRAKNEAGNSNASTSIAVKHIDEPTLKSIENSAHGVLVKWDKVTGAEKYNIYRKVSGGEYKYIGATSNIYYTDKTAESGTKYYYAIRGKRDDSISSQSASLSKYYLADPTLKSIENSAYGVLIKWDKVTGAEKYNIYRKVSGGEYEYIGETDKTYYTDKTAESGTKYYYAIRGKRVDSVSSQSASLSKYYLADPTLKTPTSTTSGIKLSWSKVTGAEGYMVYRKTGSGSYTKLATVKGSTKVTYTDSSAQKGKKYYYKVKAYKSSTYSAYSNTKAITDKY